MHTHRRILSLAAVALAAALSACSDGGGSPLANEDDPIVAAVNATANGSGQVVSVGREDKVVQGVSGNPLEPSTVMYCDPYDPYCDPCQIRCCYDCPLFSVSTTATSGWAGSLKSVYLAGSLTAQSNVSYADLYVSFRSAGAGSSCPSSVTPTQFDYSSLYGTGGPFTLSSSRNPLYSGTFVWGVRADGYAETASGGYNSKSSYKTICF